MKIALIAHDEKKNEMVNFTIAYEHIFSKYTLYATGTTGKRIMDETNLSVTRLDVRTFRRRPTNWCDAGNWRIGLNPLFP